MSCQFQLGVFLRICDGKMFFSKFYSVFIFYLGFLSLSLFVFLVIEANLFLWFCWMSWSDWICLGTNFCRVSFERTNSIFLRFSNSFFWNWYWPNLYFPKDEGKTYFFICLRRWSWICFQSLFNFLFSVGLTSLLVCRA